MELLRAEPLPPFLEEALPEVLSEELRLGLRVFPSSIVAVAAKRVAVSMAGVEVPLPAAEEVALCEERPLELALTEAAFGDFDRRAVVVGSAGVRVTYALSVPPLPPVVEAARGGEGLTEAEGVRLSVGDAVKLPVECPEAERQGVTMPEVVAV